MGIIIDINEDIGEILIKKIMEFTNDLRERIKQIRKNGLEQKSCNYNITLPYGCGTIGKNMPPIFPGQKNVDNKIVINIEISIYDLFPVSCTVEEYSGDQKIYSYTYNEEDFKKEKNYKRQFTIIQILGIIFAEQIRFNTLILLDQIEAYKDKEGAKFTLKSLFLYMFDQYKDSIYNNWSKFSQYGNDYYDTGKHIIAKNSETPIIKLLLKKEEQLMLNQHTKMSKMEILLDALKLNKESATTSSSSLEMLRENSVPVGEIDSIDVEQPDLINDVSPADNKVIKAMDPKILSSCKVAFQVIHGFIQKTIEDGATANNLDPIDALKDPNNWVRGYAHFFFPAFVYQSFTETKIDDESFTFTVDAKNIAEIGTFLALGSLGDIPEVAQMVFETLKQYNQIMIDGKNKNKNFRHMGVIPVYTSSDIYLRIIKFEMDLSLFDVKTACASAKTTHLKVNGELYTFLGNISLITAWGDAYIKTELPKAIEHMLKFAAIWDEEAFENWKKSTFKPKTKLQISRGIANVDQNDQIKDLESRLKNLEVMSLLQRDSSRPSLTFRYLELSSGSSTNTNAVESLVTQVGQLFSDERRNVSRPSPN